MVTWQTLGAWLSTCHITSSVSQRFVGASWKIDFVHSIISNSNAGRVRNCMSIGYRYQKDFKIFIFFALMEDGIRLFERQRMLIQPDGLRYPYLAPDTKLERAWLTPLRCMAAIL